MIISNFASDKENNNILNKEYNNILNKEYDYGK